MAIQYKSLAASLAGLLALAVSSGASAVDAASASGPSAHDFSFQSSHGDPVPLADYKGKLILIVNTATECGFKGQLSDLQVLHETYADQGLVVIGVPSNDFGGQEPRSNEEMTGFCEARFGTKFPLMEKTHVKGDQAHPFYKWAADTLGMAARPYWNFHKYLVGPDGSIVAWFSTPTKPTAPKVIASIEEQLGQLSLSDTPGAVGNGN